MSEPLASAPPHVLVLGRRQGLEKALRARGVDHSLWLDREPKVAPRVDRVMQAPFARTRGAVERALASFPDGPAVTHCIAAVESAVACASHARRVLGARKAPHSVARRCHDKLVMKQRLRDGGVPVTDFLDLNREEDRARVADLGAPLVVKDRVSSGSRGTTILEDPAREFAAQPVRDRLAERFVEGVEMSVESFVADGRVVWTNPTCYWRPKFVNVVPAALDEETLAVVLDCNRRALEALAIRWGMTHLELFLTADGPVVGEVALRPPGGYLMSCIETAYGFDPWDALCAVELGESPALPERASQVAAAVVLHPGAGRVAAIRGLDAVRAHPALVDARLKVEVGDAVDVREGVGEDVGRVLLAAPDRPAMDEAIRFVERELVIEVATGG